MNRRRGLPWLLAVPVAAAAGMALATCSVDRSRYTDKVYSCDLRQTDQTQECGTDWVCHPGSQLGTFDFCAPTCDAGVDGGQHYCSPDGARLTTCDPSAPVCGPDLQCLRTSVTENAGLCLPVEVCGKDDECRDPLLHSCLSKVLADAYGAGLQPGMLNNLWCLQGDCNELSPCQAGHSCLGGLPLLAKIPPVCAPNCVRNPRSDGGVDDLCPRSFVCASKVLSSLPYRFCLPGLFGFPCENDEQCLIGTCMSMGSHTKACSIPCTTNDQCQALYHPFDATKVSVACVAGQCVTAFSPFMQLLCAPNDNRCPNDAECVETKLLADAGVPDQFDIGEALCRKECKNGVQDCKDNGTARACLNYLGWTACAPGVASPAIECDPDDADACVKGLKCLTSPLALGARHYCTVSCQSDQPCQTHPWLPTDWICRGMGADQVCGPPP